VRGDNDPPDVPILLSPGDDLTTENRATVYVIAHSSDPEDDLVHYEIRLTADAEGNEFIDQVVDLQHGSGPEGTADQTSWRTELSADGTYYWTARAVDERGAASEWAAVHLLTVETPEPPPPQSPEACSDCESSFASPQGSRSSALLLLGLLGLASQRRRRKTGSRS
jgi:MYXO-CTERM domain-containing protein